jgi:hypothetical protein
MEVRNLSQDIKSTALLAVIEQVMMNINFVPDERRS